MATNKYIKAVYYNFAYFLISSLAFLVLTPLAIRVMGGEFYGLWMILFAVGQLSVIGTFGISSIVNKFASEENETQDTQSAILSSAIVIVLCMALAAAVILFFLRSFLAENINPSPIYFSQFKIALAVYALMIIPQFLIRVFQGFFLSQIMNRFARTMDLLNSLLPLLGGVLLALLYKNLIILAAWNLLVSLLVLALYVFKTRQIIVLHWMPTRAMIKRMLNFSVFMFIESAAVILFQQFDRLLVAFTLGPAASGVYSVATGAASRISMIAGNITEVLVPYASRKHSQDENDALERIVGKASFYVSLIVALVGGLLIIWMKELLSLWISPEYAAANSGLFCVIILAYSILSLSRPAHQTLVGMGKVKRTALTYLTASVVMLAAVYGLSLRLGLPGAGIANLAMAALLGMNFYLYRWFNRRRVWQRFLTDLALGILPLVLALIFFGLGFSWHYKLLYSILLLILTISLLFKDPDFIQSVKLVWAKLTNRGQATEKDDL